MRAVCYARVSSAAQRERDTIASQLRTLPEFVERQGWTLARPVGTYVDDGHSAASGKLSARAGLSTMLRDAAAGAFDVVVVVELDRLTRAEDLTERGAILGALQRAGVRVAAAASGQVLDLSTSSGDLLSSLGGYFAAEWSRKHRERIVQGKLTAIARGRKPSGPTPFGLAYSRETGAWSINADRAPIARELVERVAGGVSCRELADDLHARGVSGPRGGWKRERVNAIVRGRHLIGEWIVDKDRRMIIAVPAIVSADLWHRAQSVMGRGKVRGLTHVKHVYMLSTLMTCARCGSPIQVRSANGGRNGHPNPAAYVCRARRFFRRGEQRCPAKIVPVADLDARVWSAIAVELSDPGLAVELEARARRAAEVRHDWAKDAAGYRAHLARLDRVESALLSRFRHGTVSAAALDGELAAIGRERGAVTEQLATAERAAVAEPAIASNPRAWLEGLQELARDPTPAEQRRIAAALIALGSAVLDEGRLKLTLRVAEASSAARGAATSPVLSLVSGSNYRSPHGAELRIRLVA